MKKSHLLCGYLLLISWAAAQGPLTPPGAPAPGMKTLDQVDPRTPVNAVNTPGDATATYVISQPGSYYLTGNILGVPGEHGIRIDASYVTLDLNGFVLDGVIGSLSGIAMLDPALRGCTIRNGTLRFWGEHGLRGGSNAALILEDLRAEGNSEWGFYVSGSPIIMRNCTAIGNTLGGSRMSGHGLALGSIARNNGGDGIRFESFSFVLKDGQISGNTGEGIATPSGGNAGALLVRDTLTANNQFHGINIAAQSLLARVTAVSNTFQGVRVQRGTRVKDVQAHFNTSFGLAIQPGASVHLGPSYITGVHAMSNNAGVVVQGWRGRVQDSRFTGNTMRGLELEGGSDYSIAFGNSSTSSGWWFHTNTYGRGISAPASGPVVGNTGGAGLGTTDPWVNITH